MIKGFYSAVSAMIARLKQQELISHNISNLNTPGFKQTLTSMEEFMNVNVYSASGASTSGQIQALGEMGLGVSAAPEITDFSQGSLRGTGQVLDLAIEGDGFFNVETPEGERYTRDGRFTLDAESNLVTVDGYFVLSETGQQITLPEGEIRISSDGEIFVDGSSQASLGLAVFEDPSGELIRHPGNMYESTGQPAGDPAGSIVQGYLEMANVDPAVMMTEMSKVARAYEAAQQMVQSQDELLGKAISVLGQY